MDNDARGALLGEWMFGAAKGCRNVVMMTLGTGVGTAVICQGRPLVGPNFSAGILGGHIIVHSGGRRCTCGAVGCLEAEASGWALSAIVQSRADRRDSALSDCEPLGLKELFLHAVRGDALARELRDRFVTLWGEAIVSYVHLFDPEKVVVGGGLMQDAEVLVSFRRTVQQLAWRRNGEVPIVAACYPNDAGLLGAAALFEGLPAGALEPCPQ